MKLLQEMLPSNLPEPWVFFYLTNVAEQKVDMNFGVIYIYTLNLEVLPRAKLRQNSILTRARAFCQRGNPMAILPQVAFQLVATMKTPQTPVEVQGEEVGAVKLRSIFLFMYVPPLENTYTQLGSAPTC